MGFGYNQFGANIADVTGGTITGSGTANAVAKFTSASAIGNSVVTDDGTDVIAAPSGKLIVRKSGGTPGNDEIQFQYDFANSTARIIAKNGFDLGLQGVITRILNEAGTANTNFFASKLGLRVALSGDTYFETLEATGIKIASDKQLVFTSGTNAGGTGDTGLSRNAAAEVKVTNGSSGTGNLLAGGLRLALVTKAAADSPYTALATDYTILCNAVAGAMTVNLPAAASHTGRIYNIKKTDSSANTVTIDANSTETIDGSLTVVISTQYDNVAIQSDGSNWWRL